MYPIGNLLMTACGEGAHDELPVDVLAVYIRPQGLVLGPGHRDSITRLHRRRSHLIHRTRVPLRGMSAVSCGNCTHALPERVPGDGLTAGVTEKRRRRPGFGNSVESGLPHAA